LSTEGVKQLASTIKLPLYIKYSMRDPISDVHIVSEPCLSDMSYNANDV